MLALVKAPEITLATAEPDGNAPGQWFFKSKFIITLKSRQTIEVRFIPGLEGELRLQGNQT